jgi:hypothetical protein
MYRRLIRFELILNVMLVVTVASVGIRLHRGSEYREARPTLSQVSADRLIGNDDAGVGHRTLVLALSTTCHFCSESAPFYRALVARASEDPELRIMAVFPQSVEEGAAYLSRVAVPISLVRHADLTAAGVAGTPALVIFDRDRKAQRIWLGRLSLDGEARILRPGPKNPIWTKDPIL